MKKKYEVSNPKSCPNTAGAEDFIFVLKQTDPATAATIRFWVRERIKRGHNEVGDAKTEAALFEAQIVELKQVGSNTDELERQLAKLSSWG